MSASDNLGPQFVDAFHAAPRGAAASIKEKGIQPSPNSIAGDSDLFEERGHEAGAFFFQNKQHLKAYLGKDSPNMDVWHGKVALEDTYQDPFIEDADYTTTPIVGVKPVGHTTYGGGVHWYPRKGCPRCG
jgi:hypothetical protein